MRPTAAVVHIAARYGAEEGLVAADAAWRAGLTSRPELQAYVGQRARSRGIRSARLVAHLADPRAASLPESRLRYVWVVEAGLPVPLVNVTLTDTDGHRLGDPDLLDTEAALVGEYDGAHHRELDNHTRDNAREEGFEAPQPCGRPRDLDRPVATSPAPGAAARGRIPAGSRARPSPRRLRPPRPPMIERCEVVPWRHGVSSVFAALGAWDVLVALGGSVGSEELGEPAGAGGERRSRRPGRASSASLATPVSGSDRLAWKASSTRRVRASKPPVTYRARISSASCRSRTAGPVSPRRSVVPSHRVSGCGCSALPCRRAQVTLRSRSPSTHCPSSTGPPEKLGSRHRRRASR